tara:strand:- start:413 stop:745 length:333 start_codon:yes stop_codon:yes gene_type:complete
MTRRKRIYGKRRKKSAFKQEPKERQGNVYVGDKKFSDKPMYEDQKPSTHLMAYGESDGKYVAYPTLFQDDDGMWYQPDDPFREAIKKKEIYQFGTEEEAAEFAGGSWKNK